MKTSYRIWALLLLVVCAPAFAQRRAPQVRYGRYESNKRYTGRAHNQIDALIMANLRAQGIQPANLCSDEVFVRRVYLDVIGTLPTPQELRKFLQNTSTRRRGALINALLKREEYAQYWAMKWCDVLRVKAEFPINLWPNAVQAYHRWIYDSLRNNLPYDDFARELLTASGSNFRVPQVNFYRALQGQEPATLARAAGLTFMGVRVEKWPKEKQARLAAFFSRVAYKNTAEWKEEIVYLDPTPVEAQQAVFPDGTAVQIQPDQDPRQVFADWLITADNPWFARCMVNRVWAWLLGRGLVHEPDDIRPDNPAVHPRVLDYLAQELIRSKYNLQHIYRLILNSRTYQQSSIPRSQHAEAEALFAHYPVRRLDAEVLIDALCLIFGSRESYSSAIPEPFTFIPEENRSIELADGSITSQFLEMFGRPARDTGLALERNNQPTDAQRLHLLNSSHIQNKIERSGRLRGLIKASKGKKDQLITSIYLNVLSRYPMQPELVAAQNYFNTEGINSQQATHDLAWALINTKEFLYHH